MILASRVAMNLAEARGNGLVKRLTCIALPIRGLVVAASVIEGWRARGPCRRWTGSAPDGKA